MEIFYREIELLAQDPEIPSVNPLSILSSSIAVSMSFEKGLGPWYEDLSGIVYFNLSFTQQASNPLCNTAQSRVQNSGKFILKNQSQTQTSHS